MAKNKPIKTKRLTVKQKRQLNRAKKLEDLAQAAERAQTKAFDFGRSSIKTHEVIEHKDEPTYAPSINILFWHLTPRFFWIFSIAFLTIAIALAFTLLFIFI